MSRSYRHTPFVPLAGGRHTSERYDKKIWHARRRMLERLQDARLGFEERYPVSKHAAINNYCMNKDGHFYWGTRCDVGKDDGYADLRAYYRGVFK